LVRSTGRVTSCTKASVEEIIASIWSRSPLILARRSSGAASMRKRRRVSGVRRSWAIAAMVVVRLVT
jgi:hypothetical protein